ncbi:MAG TPA: hypothetical protein VJ483_09525 [Holophagaceae bacterium]|nr:hypothetical protein [Holophagaceae bacterium]
MRRAALLALLALAACHKGPDAAPKLSPSLALLPKSGFYAAAYADHGNWRLDLHLGGPDEVRTFEARSSEGFAITVAPRKSGPVASWTVAPARFLSGAPFLVTLKTTGGQIPLRIEVPGVRPGQDLVGLNVVVVK